MLPGAWTLTANSGKSNIVANLEFSNLLDVDNYHPSQNRNADFKVRAETRKELKPVNRQAGFSNNSCEGSSENSSQKSSEPSSDEVDNIRLDIIESAMPPACTVRLTAVVTLQAQARFELQNYAQGFEILILEGDLMAACRGEKLQAAKEQYLRIPFGQQASFESESGCTLLIKLGQMSETDHELRSICTNDQNLWLPGPADGTEVLPLHLHDTKSVLLIRWNEPAYFKPQLDPRGEEIFVVEGTLHDAYGSYDRGSWIRNPVPAWQAWGGHPGTLVYYKNGHFPTD